MDTESITPQEKKSYALLDGASEGIGRSKACKIFRYSAIFGAAFLCLCLIGDAVISDLISSMDIANRRTVNIRGVQDKYATVNEQFRAEPSCPADGRVCICSHGFHVAGPDPYFPDLNAIVPDPGSTACQPWKFQIGDIIMTEKPTGGHYWQADLVAKWTKSNVVHCAIVSEIPPEGTPQNGGNVFVTEALKGNIKMVVRNSLKTLVERYPFGGVHIRRVDAARFPFFANNAWAIQQFLQARLNEPFDKKMVNPVTRQFGDPRFVSVNPWCDTKVKTFNTYMAGGPGQWICSQLVAWTLAFPGGLNTQSTDPLYTDPGCAQPKWNVLNLQPNPGDFEKPEEVNYLGPEDYYIPCPPDGCFMALSEQGNTMVSPASLTAPALYTPGTPAPTLAPTPAPTPAPTGIATAAPYATAAPTPATTFAAPTPAAPPAIPPAPGAPPPQLATNSYCAGERNDFGFGFTLFSCVARVRQDAACTDKKFDFNSAYNGQCKCSINGGCTTYMPGTGYVVYQG